MDLITLNIGGTRFETTLSTLLKYESIFQSLLADKPNYLFIDRDPKFFPIILNYFRTGYFECPEGGDKGLAFELLYYNIKNLIEKRNFQFVEVNDRKGIFQFLSMRTRENPIDTKEVEAYMGDYHSYLGTKLQQIPLKNLLDFDDRIKEERPCFSPHKKEPFLIIRLAKQARIKPNVFCIENTRAQHLDFDPKELFICGSSVNSIQEAIKEKDNWVTLEVNEVIYRENVKVFRVTSYESYNTFKLESSVKATTPIILSRLEIYGTLTEKGQ